MTSDFTVVETDPRTKNILSTTSYFVTLDYDV